MRTLPIKSRLRWLRALCGTLLALHVGLAQANMAHDGAMHTEAGLAHGASPTSLEITRCHGDAIAVGLAAVDKDLSVAASSAPAEGHGARHTPCCKTGDCHCAAACVPDVATTFLLIGLTNHTVVTPGDARAAFPPQLARELRPPIAS